MADALKILVVDDEKIIRDLFEFTLSYSGHTVRLVDESRRAVEAVRDGEFDAVFVDIVMPDKDGVEVLKEIKGIRPEVPVIMMSGYSAEDKRQQALEAGALKCLNKPFEVDDIKAVLKEIVSKRKEI